MAKNYSYKESGQYHRSMLLHINNPPVEAIKLFLPQVQVILKTEVGHVESVHLSSQKQEFRKRECLSLR